VAAPHARADGKLVPLAQTDHDNNAPAGSINSCAADLAKWMMAQLAHGAYPGGRLFSEAQSREMWSAQTILPIADLPKGAPAVLQPNFSAYGLGWMLRDWRGRKMVYHTGTLAGYVSRTTLIPDLQLGVVVLTNQEAAAAHAAIAYTIVDHFLGAPGVDWVNALKETEPREEPLPPHNAASKPSLPPAGYAGTYHDAWYGDVVVRDAGGRLSISFTHTKQLAGRLEHWQYDTFIAHWNDRTLNADAFVTFRLGPDGKVESVKVQPVSPLTDFSFDFQDLDLRPVSAARQ
jgi:hypothetical protein